MWKLSQSESSASLLKELSPVSLSCSGLLGSGAKYYVGGLCIYKNIFNGFTLSAVSVI